MLELVRCDAAEIVFRHAYPRSLGHLILWMGACFVVFDGYLATFGRIDIPLWATFGLFVPCAVALLVAGVHVLRYSAVLRIDCGERTYSERREGLWGRGRRQGSIAEFRQVTRLGGSQVWLESNQ